MGIYAEWEPGRALPGELALPVGPYLCEFILTEESFHQSGLGGGWASAMGVDIQFAVALPCDGDLDEDGDVDGSDLAVLDTDLTDLSAFAAEFGRPNCRLCGE